MAERKIALAALTVLELPHPELVSVAAQAGYSHVGLRLVPVAGQPHLHPLDVGAIEGRLADTGVKVLDVEVFRLDAETRIGNFEEIFSVSARLGASQLLAHGADPLESRLVDNFARLCDLAARYGLSVNLEPMPWVEISTVAKARRIIDAAGRANGAVLVDAIHFFRADNSFGDLKGARMNYLQFCDARAERPTDMPEMIRQARGDRLPPGEGGLDLRGLLSCFPKDLPLSLEVPMARPMPPLERAKLVYQAAVKVLG
ncbi:MAG TPA: TIM barrel protein [Burkholderiales bacterium]|nr:TIM barrel protein [Burkholderiales bacterium]